MANIRIDPDTMDQRASQYRTEAQNVANVISNMDRLLANLQSEWEGEASKSYANRYQTDFKPNRRPSSLSRKSPRRLTRRPPRCVSRMLPSLLASERNAHDRHRPVARSS